MSLSKIQSSHPDPLPAIDQERDAAPKTRPLVRTYPNPITVSLQTCLQIILTRSDSHHLINLKPHGPQLTAPAHPRDDPSQCSRPVVMTHCQMFHLQVNLTFESVAVPYCPDDLPSVNVNSYGCQYFAGLSCYATLMVFLSGRRLALSAEQWEHVPAPRKNSKASVH